MEHCNLIEENDLKDLDSFLLNKYSSKIDDFIDGKGDKPKKKQIKSVKQQHSTFINGKINKVLTCIFSIFKY